MSASRGVQVVQLTVRSARSDDVYKDIARIGRDDRGKFRTGRPYRFSVNGRSVPLVLRGVGAQNRGAILIDEATRSRLGVQYGKPYEFQVRELGFFAELWWGWGSSDPTVRSMSRVAVISLGLGTLSVILGLLGIVLAALATKGND
jgi:hypothetical protein